jgi:large subunit ribosomal protein L6
MSGNQEKQLLSRMGKKPVVLPDKVKAEVKNQILSVSGPAGTVSVEIISGFNVAVAGGKITVQPETATESSKKLHGLLRGLVKNAVQGSATGFSKTLEIYGMGYKAQADGTNLTLQVGYSHPVKMVIPRGLKVTLDKQQTIITIAGADKQQVGQFAAQVRAQRPPEPYNATGIRYQGEHIIRKAGKAAVAAGGAAAGGVTK